MSTRRNAFLRNVGFITIVLVVGSTPSAGRQYKTRERETSGSREASGEEGAPFSAEFGEFFEGEGPKESSEGAFTPFPADFHPEVIPYSESRNVTRYINPVETYHSVKDIPGSRRDQRYRPTSEEIPNYKDDNYKIDESYVKQVPYPKEDSYRKDKSYKKSDSGRKEKSYRSKEEPQYASGEPPYRKHSSSSRKDDDKYKGDGGRSTYRSHSESRQPKDSSSYKIDPSYRRSATDDVEDDRRRRPIQTAYDDWSPEQDEAERSYRDRSYRDSREMSSEYDEADYSDTPPPPADPEPRSKSIPTSMRPGPPYYSPTPRRTAEARSHTGSYRSRHDYPTQPTTQTFYAPSTTQRKHDQGNTRELQPRKGEPTKASRPPDFRPSPPDPLSKSRAREEYPQTEYTNPVPDKVSSASTKMSKRQKCVKLKKMSSPEPATGKFLRKVSTCYVCVDEKTGMNYEECSYENESKTRPYLKTSNAEEANKTKISHREKRDVTAAAAIGELEKKRAERAKRDKDYYESKEEKDSSKNESDEEEEGVEEESSASAEESSSEDNCYKKKKGDMSCIVCQTPNKKGTYEQCSYAGDPQENKYAHSFEKVYGTPRLPEFGSRVGKSSDSSGSKEEDYDGSAESSSKDYPSPDYGSSGDSGSKKSGDKAFGGGQFGGLGEFGDDFEGLFGDLSGEEGFDFDSIPEPAESKGQFSTKVESFKFLPDDTEDMNISKNIGDFAQKNRSNCKKVIKNKMTCYQCITSAGTKNEECMYIEAAEPKAKHLSFSQVEEYGYDPLNATKLSTESFEAPIPNKRKYKKYHPDLVDMKFNSKLMGKARMLIPQLPRSKRKVVQTDNSSTVESKDNKPVPASKDQSVAASEQHPAKAVEGSSSSDEEEEDEEESDEEDEEDEEEKGDKKTEVTGEYNAIPTEPPSLDLKEAEKGEFHSETEAAWDPKLGISLPKYMLERSEHEAIFDEVLASG